MSAERHVFVREGGESTDLWGGAAMMIEFLDCIKKRSGEVPDSIFSSQPLLVGFDSTLAQVPSGFKYALLRVRNARDSYVMRSGWGRKGQERGRCPFMRDSVHLWYIDDRTIVKMSDEEMFDLRDQAADCLKRNGLLILVANPLTASMTEKLLLRALGTRIRTTEEINWLMTHSRELKQIALGIDFRRDRLQHFVFARRDSDFPCIQGAFDCFGD